MAETSAAAAEQQRWPEISGASNFRDVGGLPTADGRHTKWRRFFRSDALNALSAEDWGNLAGKLNVRHVCDLRYGAEQSVFPVRPPADIALHTWEYSQASEEELQAMADHVRAALQPLNAMDDKRLVTHVIGMHANYADAPRMLAKHIRGVFDVVLAECRRKDDEGSAAAASVVVFCSAGKDRTGWATALLLETLGVTRDAVLDDYELTTTAYVTHPPSKERLGPLLRAQGLDELEERVIAAMSLAYRDVMGDALDAIAKAAPGGTVLGFVQKELGVTDEEVALLRASLLE